MNIVPLCLSYVLLTGGTEPAIPPVKAGAVVVVGEIPAITMSAGDTISVTVPFTIAAGFHIQANPASNEFLIPLELGFDPVAGFEFAVPLYPKARAFRLEGTSEDLLTYHGSVAVAVRVVVSGDAPPGLQTVLATLRYQACDSSRCLFPASVSFKFELVVAAKP